MERTRRTGHVRQVVQLRTSAAAVATLAGIEPVSLRQHAAHVLAVPLRLVTALAAALAAACAGLVFVVLLPICGLATVAEAATTASWHAVKANVRGCLRRGALSQD